MKIIIWGTGSFYRKRKFEIWEMLKDYDIEIIAFTDNNASAKKGLTIDGKPVLECSELQNIEFDKIVLMVGDDFYTVIKYQLIKDLGIPNEKISSFLDFIVDIKMMDTKEMVTKLYFNQICAL